MPKRILGLPNLSPPYHKTGIPGYRLPTEAEWVYAARGGVLALDFPYAGGEKLDALGWYRDNSYGSTKPVGLKRPNVLGLFDLCGNIWEWCADHWHSDYQGAPEDGAAWVDGIEDSRRVLRGGSWGSSAGNCRVSYRSSDSPGYLLDLQDYAGSDAYRSSDAPTYRSSNLGFRLAF